MALYRTTMPTQTDYSAQNQARLAERQAQLAQRAAGEQQRQAAMTAANQAARPAPAPSLSSMMRDYVNAPNRPMGSLRSLTPEEMARVQASQQRTAAMDPEDLARAQAAAQAQLQAYVDAQRGGMGGDPRFSQSAADTQARNLVYGAQAGPPSPAAPALANANPNAAFNRAGNPLGQMMTRGLPPSYLSANPELQQQAQWAQRAAAAQQRANSATQSLPNTLPYHQRPGYDPQGDDFIPRNPDGTPKPGYEHRMNSTPRPSNGTFGANKSPPSAPPGASMASRTPGAGMTTGGLFPAPQGAGSPERDAYLRRQAFAQRLAAPRSPTG